MTHVVSGMYREGFDRDHQPVVDVNWYHDKGWTLAKGRLYDFTLGTIRGRIDDGNIAVS